MWAHNACIKLYCYDSKASPKELRHWSIEVFVGETTWVNSDLGNDLDGQPGTKKSPYKDDVDGWEEWATDTKPKARVRILPYSGHNKSPNLRLVGEATIEVDEVQGLEAYAQVGKVLLLADSEKWKWNLTSHSCFEYVAKILRAGGQKLPTTPGDAASRRRLINRLNGLVGLPDI